MKTKCLRPLLTSQMLATAALLLLTSPASAQFQYGWVMPRESQGASVSQTVGVTEITIKYHRPAVKNRVVWGGLVPYDQVWRAGANEATTISFSTEVKIEGQPLAAGTYALFVIPAATEWTVIFNKTAKQWGAFTYKEAADALRVKVKPQPAEHQEQLQYSFPVVTDSAAQVALHWEKVKVPFTISADTPAQAAAKAKASFSWEAGWFAADYLYKSKSHLDEALKWINASLALDENGSSLLLKAKILAEMKRYNEAVRLGEQAIKLIKAKVPSWPAAETEKLIAEWKRQASTQ